MRVFPNHFAINFYIKGEAKQFDRRVLSQVPNMHDVLVFNDERYWVHSLEWCLDNDATNGDYQALVNIEMIKRPK